MGENDIVIAFDKDEVKPKEELNGTIKINYRGRYDSVVLNLQIQNSSDIFTFIKLNEKKINHSFARMSILKQEIKNVNEINFTAITEHVEIQYRKKLAESLQSLEKTSVSLINFF